jgi:hypothetical protein
MKLTLCGSTRFRDQFEDWNRRLSKMGHIVYSVSSYGHSGDTLTPAEKEMLDLVHLRKIVEGDGIFLVGLEPTEIDMAGTQGARLYIGDSTRREIAWARLWGKRVFRLDDESAEGFCEWSAPTAVL